MPPKTVKNAVVTDATANKIPETPDMVITEGETATGDVMQPASIVQEPEISMESPTVGTMVPVVSTEQERCIVHFLIPYQRYTRGDLAGFSAEIAQQLVARNIACWPEDVEGKTKKDGSDDYPFAV